MEILNLILSINVKSGWKAYNYNNNIASKKDFTEFFFTKKWNLNAFMIV